MNNPIIDEVRRIRDEHARKHNYDLAAICKNFREHQKTCGHPVVARRPRDEQTFQVAEDIAEYGENNGS